VTTNETANTTIPIIRDNELRLAKMRRRLEDLFLSLDIVQDEVTVAAEAARSHGIPDVANVLSLSVCNRLSSQLRLLTHVIEQLGGTTELSKESEPKEQPGPPNP
jgi:hypothetical protein